jgi:putative ABC transport system ATP-binding protein
MESDPILISARGLSKTFSNGGVQQHVLKNIDLDIRAGEFAVVMGASGAGKSTLLYALSGMDLPTLGEVSIDGVNLSGKSQSQLAIFRRTHCGFVFQQSNLLTTMSLLDNAIAAGALVDHNRKQVAEHARKLFSQVGISVDTQKKFPGQVSGGEAGRAAIVRALINDPAVVFADEPTGNLDQSSGTAVLDALNSANRAGQTVVMVTHDLRSALRGDRIVFLRDGSITGNLDLAKFDSDATGQEQAVRQDKLRGFLIEMGW